MRNHIALLLAGTFAFMSIAAAEEPRFRFKRELDRAPGAGTGEEILAVQLDSEIYAGTREGFPDLRIRDDSGREVPYVVEQVGSRKMRTAREICSSEAISVRSLEGNSLEVVIRLGEKAPSATGLTIHTPLVDYEHRVKVYGSSDGKDWSPLESNGLIFDYSRFMDIQNREVKLPTNKARQFKIVVEQVEDELESPYRVLTRGQRKKGDEKQVETKVLARRPFRIDKVELWRTVETESAKEFERKVYPVDAFKVEEQPKTKATRIRVSTRREPLNRFTLQVGSKNFSRAVTVRIPVKQGVETTWAEIGRGRLYQIQFRDFQREELRIDFPENREGQFEIDIQNEDSPAVEITGVKAEGNVYRLVFLGAAQRQYHLEYGSQTAVAPRYDTATVLASLGPGIKPVEVALKGQVENPKYEPSRSVRDLLNQPIVLIAAIALMVVVLCLAMIRAGNLVKQVPEDEKGRKTIV